MNTRILYIVPSWFTLHYRLRGHLSYMKERGYDVEVVGEKDARAETAAAREGVRYYPMEMGPEAGIRETLRTAAALVQLVREQQYDVVHCCTKTWGLLGALAARLGGAGSVVYLVRGLSMAPVGPLKRALFDQIERWIARAADRVIVLSPTNRDFFRDRRLCEPRKLVMLGNGSSNGIDMDRFSPSRHREAGAALRRRLNIPTDAKVVGFVGRLVRLKGIRELAAAWSVLADRHPDVYLLILAPPETEPELAAPLEALRSHPRVRFGGFLEDPAPGYGAMDVLGLPSYEEGLSNVILEAGAMELPVVATDAPGCGDAVLHEETGLIVPQRNAEALIAAVGRMLTNPNAARGWGKHGRRHCGSLYAQEIVWSAFADLYDDLRRAA